MNNVPISTTYYIIMIQESQSIFFVELKDLEQVFTEDDIDSFRVNLRSLSMMVYILQNFREINILVKSQTVTWFHGKRFEMGGKWNLRNFTAAKRKN